MRITSILIAVNGIQEKLVKGIRDSEIITCNNYPRDTAWYQDNRILDSNTMGFENASKRSHNTIGKIYNNQ